MTNELTQNRKLGKRIFVVPTGRLVSIYLSIYSKLVTVFIRKTIPPEI